MKTLLLCVLAAQVLSCASVSQVEIEFGTLAVERLYKKDVSQTCVVKGSFRPKSADSASGGIRFKSTENAVEITTTDCKVLVSASRSSESAVKNSFSGKSDRDTVYQILTDTFVETNGRLYRSAKPARILSALPDAIEGAGDASAEMQASIERLVDHPAMELLEPASIALGQDLEITGRNTPCSMPFHMLSLSLTKARKWKDRTQMQKSSSSLWKTLFLDKLRKLAASQGAFPNCDLSTCPPCKEDQCYGMCGYGCSCWIHLCGNCCYHRGCSDHDTCCRRDGLFSPSCAFPIWFICDAPFNCRPTVPKFPNLG